MQRPRCMTPRPAATRRPWIATPAVLALLLVPLQDARAQHHSAKRVSTRGTVTTLEGKPWVGAKIRLWAMPLRNRAYGQADVVEVTSDARGRFRAKLRSDRIYSAIASASATKAGQPGEKSAEKPAEKPNAQPEEFRRSHVVQEVFARDTVRLREAKKRGTAHTIQIESSEDPATLTVDVLVAALNREVVRATHQGDGAFLVPCSPFPYFSVSVRNARGSLVARKRLGDEGNLPRKLVIKKPRELRILDKDGAPLAARASVWSGLRIDKFARRSPLRWLGIEPIALDRSEKGLLRIYPATGQSHFIIHAAGHRSLKVALDGPTEYRMTPRAPMRLRIVRKTEAGTSPLTGARLFFVDHNVAANPGQESNDGGSLCEAGVRMCVTDADGRAQWNSLRGHAIRIEVENTPAVLEALQLESAQERIPIATLNAADVRGSEEVLVEIPELVSCEVAVRGSDGAPVRGAILALREDELGNLGPENAIEAFTDVRGRARFVVERRKWQAAIVDPAHGELKLQELDVTRDSKSEATLERMPRFTLLCLQGDTPVAGRRGSMGTSSMTFLGHFFREASAWNKSIDARSDAEGRMPIPYWPMQQANFVLYVAKPGQSRWAGVRIPFTPTGGDREVEVQVPR